MTASYHGWVNVIRVAQSELGQVTTYKALLILFTLATRKVVYASCTQFFVAVMSRQEGLVFSKCVHNGCECKRLFLRSKLDKPQEYVCIKHRRLHRSVPTFESSVIKAGQLLKKGSRSTNLSKRCIVLLQDRIVIYGNVGDSYAIRLGNGGNDFRSWDEDDYVTPGIGITRETKRPSDLDKHHHLVIKELQKKVIQRCMTRVKGDDQETLSLNIWTGTWNMGECDPPYNLEEWVPNSFDIIAIGILKSFITLELPELEMRACGVIGSDFMYYTEKIGSVRKEVGFHGFIAMVFIRIDLIQCGLIPTASLSTKTIALGKNLVVTRASNKGGVRVRCPLDLDVLGLGERTSIDFLCCHLAADQQGESQLEKRNQNAFELVQALVYDGESTGYVFIMGDFNYRLTMSPDSCIEMIRDGFGNQKNDAICSLYDNDQLISCLSTAASFPGFQELTLPSFPPTYKKRKQLSTLPDYSSPASVYDKNRTPSYTDRIVFQSFDSQHLVRVFVYAYDTIESIRDSDHTPVYGAVSLRIGPNAEHGPTKTQLIPSPSQGRIQSILSSSIFFRYFIPSSGTLEPMDETTLASLLPYLSFSFIHPNTVITQPTNSHEVSLLILIRGEVQLLTEKYELKTVHEGEWFGGEGLLDCECGYTSVSTKECVCACVSENTISQLIREGKSSLAVSLKRLVLGQSLQALQSMLQGLLSEYDHDILNLLRHQMTTVCKRKGKVLAHEGESVRAVFYVIAGGLIVTARDPDGEDVIVARLGPDTVCGTETLLQGGKSLFTITTEYDSLLTILNAEAYEEYLRLDPSQSEGPRQYDQMMYRWVNTHQLPLRKKSPQVLSLLSLLFGASEYDPEKVIWNPEREYGGFRVLLEGQGTRNFQEIAEDLSEENEFDMDTPIPSSKQSVDPGAILNASTEKVRCVTRCSVVTVDKKELKRLCMMIRWPFFGYGIRIPSMDVLVHIHLQGINRYSQPIPVESFFTRDIRSPYRWNENFRLGDGPLGLTELTGLCVSIEMVGNERISEQIIPLDSLCEDLKEKGTTRRDLNFSQGCKLVLLFRGLSAEAMAIPLEDYVFESISVVSSTNLLSPLRVTEKREEDMLHFAPEKPQKPPRPQKPKPLPPRPTSGVLPLYPKESTVKPPLPVKPVPPPKPVKPKESYNW
ncbi:endonuclease exonuclease phosphatase [Blastocystis sp. subtype 4]|uniref:endonuclease exonuclease phosphatase n=1 Tax=Blastocystis sp. subtype 4 TaxID=944170 RepID=UPI0007119DE8|nr:endonuclease exonuclease phosphatase [Blastocystis sp. subtype 4]KNB43711.1 endonuclease exonuclease phosphatase [Blastocystis sp. subtype 4]|eukprot:XP_014527154.1 endonuclease exonuclease phosphatase [Blastocystis sp. subtype 4]